MDDRMAAVPIISAEHAADIRSIALQLESLRPSKEARSAGQKQLRALLDQLLFNTVSEGMGSETSSAPRCKAGQNKSKRLSTTEEEDEAIAKAGMTTVSDRVRDLVSRMEPIVNLNLRSFTDFYRLKGMLIGSGEPTDDEMQASQQWRREYDSHASESRVWAGPSPVAARQR
jgi:hypothetical protein